MKDLTIKIFGNISYCNEIDGVNYFRGYKLTVGEVIDEEGDYELANLGGTCYIETVSGTGGFCREGELIQQKLNEELYVSLKNLDTEYFGECFEW